MTGPLRVLVVDDEAPARDDLAYMLGRHTAVGRVDAAADAVTALRYLETTGADAVFIDIRMPGLDGMELARVLLRFRHPPAVVFVTAFERYAVEAFAVEATDYLLKPVGEARLSAALDRIRPAPQVDPSSGAGVAEVGPPEVGVAEVGMSDLAVVAIEHGDETLLVERDSISHVVAAGDYVRLHAVDGGRHLVRLPLQHLEVLWQPHGFVRVHRQHLVNLAKVTSLRHDGSVLVVCLGATELPVSRRHSRVLREQLGARRPRGPQ